MTQLDAFSATMEIGTTVGAAKALYTSQPSISRALKQLEDATRLVLFERIDNRLCPTREAYKLLEIVDQSYIGINRIMRAADELRDASDKYLSIGCLPAFTHGYIAGVLQRFLEQNSNIRLNIKPMLSREVLSGMLTREIDIGIGAYAILTDRLNCETLVSVNEVLVCHRDHPLAKHDVVRPRDLNGHSILLLDGDDPYRRRFERHLGQLDICCPIRAEVPTSATICKLVERNLGVAMVNPITAMDHSDHGLIMRTYEKNFPFHVTLLTSDNRHYSTIGKQFVNAIKEEIADRLRASEVILSQTI